MSKLEQLKEKAKGLEARDPKRAIEIWIEALRAQDSESEANPDLSIYNRVGDLFLKLKDPAQAADYYDNAVDKYAELGLHNNAIAMCNKVLRNAPARQATYLKLAKLYATKGFMVEAKQNFVEYAERMQKVGKVDHAFAALKEVIDLSPDREGLRQMLAEHLKMYGEPSRRPSAPHAPSAEDEDKPGKKTSNLVFLDLDEPPVGKTKVPGARPKPPAPPPPPSAPTAPAKGAPPRVGPPPRPASGSRPAAPSPVPPPSVARRKGVGDGGLEIETTSLADDEGTPDASGVLDGLETTHVDFGKVSASAGSPPSLREELDPRTMDLPPLRELEPTAAPQQRADPLDEADLVLEGNVIDAPQVPPPPKPKAKWSFFKGKPKAVEVPPLELEPDFETTAAEHSPDVDDEPLALSEGETGHFVETEEDTSISIGGRKSGFIDLGLEGVEPLSESGGLVFSDIEDAPAGASIEELEVRVADDPDDAEGHVALGEALIEAGERERGIEELDLATGGFENAGALQQARDLVDEILRLDPNSVRHRQKAVEFAFKGGEKAKLVDAYLELADTLLRTDLPDKARAVYERVAEHDPTNERAKAALAMLAPVAVPPKPEGKVKAKDARMKVRDDTLEGADFVDLGQIILDPEDDVKDTRMTVADEEPTGDEEADFREMLARFKQGIDENIDETDFQSHYDLGVAFKEMGLLDEAIAEFQKALRAPEGKPRTSEALGVCFFDKGAHGVAESILRRGLELPAAGDQERLGILYWLGRALEEQGRGPEARDLYGRVFAVDIRFKDVEKRVKALAKAK